MHHTTKLARTLLCSAALALAPFFAAAAHAAELIVEVQGVASSDGNILLAVFENGENFLKKPVAVGMAQASKGQTEVRIKDLPAGEYAISAFHDVNQNNKLDKNAVGMPIEDFAFSNNAIGDMGPPSFAAAAVKHPASGGKLTLRFN